MEKLYIGVIYTLKQKGYSQEEVAKFLHKFTDTPIEYYTPEILMTVLQNTMLAAIQENSHPASIVREYFMYKQFPWDYDEWQAICAAISSIEVRHKNSETNKYEFINGFGPMEGFIDD